MTLLWLQRFVQWAYHGQAWGKRRIPCLWLFAVLSATYAAERQPLTRPLVIPRQPPALQFAGKEIRVAPALAERMALAENAALLPVPQDGSLTSRLWWLLLRTPSKATNGIAFCGAGHEDYLVLIDARGDETTAKDVDEVILQSCLHSISMNVDTFDDLLALVRRDSKDGQFKIEQSAPSSMETYERIVVISAKDDRMRIETRRRQRRPDFGLRAPPRAA